MKNKWLISSHEQWLHWHCLASYTEKEVKAFKAGIEFVHELQDSCCHWYIWPDNQYEILELEDLEGFRNMMKDLDPDRTRYEDV